MPKFEFKRYPTKDSLNEELVSRLILQDVPRDLYDSDNILRKYEQEDFSEELFSFLQD